MIVVATYHILPTADPIVRELVASGVGPDDIRVSDHVDPVAANAPESIEKESGFFEWLTGVEDLDVDAYRRAVQRGRTVVTVRTTQPQADKVEAVLQKFDPIEVTEPATADAASPGRGPGESVGKMAGVRRYLTSSEKQG
jgi:hypothetical protein